MFHQRLTVALALAALVDASSFARAADDDLFKPVKPILEQTCVKCHGEDGKGQTKMGQKAGVKDLTDAKLQAELKDDQAFKAVKEGIKDSEGKIKMKPAEGLSDDDIKGLVKHVRTFKK